MKKHLVLALAALALVACGGNTPPTTPAAPTTATPTTVAPQATVITINADDQTELKAACNGEVYHSDVVNFTTDGTAWAFTANCGLPKAEYNPGYAEHNLFQLKKNADGAIYNTEALTAGYSKATVTFYAKYDGQEEKYFPVVSEGTAADALIAANHTATIDASTGKLAGEAAGWSDGANAQYKYTVEYTLSPSSTFFKVASGAGALYLESIVLA